MRNHVNATLIRKGEETMVQTRPTRVTEARKGEKTMVQTRPTRSTGVWQMMGKGALAGMIATVPMTLFMLLMQRVLPKWQHYDLPPEKITDELAERADVKKHLDKPKRVGVALIAHFGYGATIGALYPFLAKSVSFPAILKGIIFGLLVWAGSYLGLLPALQMKASASREPVQRNLLMIVAHVIWGAVLGICSR